MRDRQRPVDFKREKIIFAPQKKQESVEEIRKKYEARMKESERVRLLSGVMKEQSEELGGLEKIVETREAREAREAREMQEKIEKEYDTDEENLMEMISSFRREPKLLKN